MRQAVADPRVDSLLLPEERLVAVVRHHWLRYLPGTLQVAAALALGTWWLLVTDVEAAWVPFAAMVGVAGHGCYRLLREHLDRFVVTSTRVFRVSGVFDQRTASMPISRVLDVTVRKPLAGRLLGYGHLVLEAAAPEQGLRDITSVPHPDRLDQLIQSTRLRAERRRRRGPRRRAASPLYLRRQRVP